MCQLSVNEVYVHVVVVYVHVVSLRSLSLFFNLRYLSSDPMAEGGRKRDESGAGAGRRGRGGGEREGTRRSKRQKKRAREEDEEDEGESLLMEGSSQTTSLLRGMDNRTALLTRLAEVQWKSSKIDNLRCN